MFLLSSLVRTYPLILSVVLFQVGDKTAQYRVSQQSAASSADRQMSMVVWTDRAKYSLRDAIKVNAALQNNGDETRYVDRRMFWQGYAAGLELQIRNEKGKRLPARFLSDAPMPLPEEGDASILIRLEPGFLYGTYLYLNVNDFFPKPGRYSIRVAYKSWLIKETVAPQLRNLPALWIDSPEIISEPAWIHVTPAAKKVPR